MRACATPLLVAAGGTVTTIEARDTPTWRAVQQAWAELGVVQCGFGQSEEIMSAAALLTNNPGPKDADIDAAMSDNICRCSTYARIRAAIYRATEQLA